MAQTISAPHIAKPNHEALSISAATTATIARTDRDPAVGQIIAAIVQPRDLGEIVRRAEHDIGQQQQFERHQIGRRERQQHQAEMDCVVAAHGDVPRYGPQVRAGVDNLQLSTASRSNALLAAPRCVLGLSRQDFTAPAVSPPTM